LAGVHLRKYLFYVSLRLGVRCLIVFHVVSFYRGAYY
jgi:hypothetical protein